MTKKTKGEKALEACGSWANREDITDDWLAEQRKGWQPSREKLELWGWLDLAEQSFGFWGNREDAVYDNC